MPPGDAQRQGCPSLLASLPRLGLAPKPLVMGRDIQGSSGAARGCPQQHPKGGGATCLPQPLGRCQPWPRLPAGWHGPRHGSWGGAASLVSSQQSCVARDLLRALQRRRRESVLQHKQQRVGVGVVQATQRRARTAALGMRQRAVPWLQWEQPPSPEQAGGCSSLPPYPPAPTQPPASAEGDRSVPWGSLGTYPSQSPVWPW